MPGWTQILIVIALIVLLFGRGKISDMMGDVAKGIRSFKKGLSDEDENPSSQPHPKTIDATVSHDETVEAKNKASNG
ncbi:MAG: twin-arginine translocase TatA/TatE family subunit [Parvibaculum sp.]